MVRDGAVASEIAVSAGKAAPPLGVTGWAFLGGHLNEIVAVLTILYTLLLIAEKVWKLWKLRKEG